MTGDPCFEAAAKHEWPPATRTNMLLKRSEQTLKIFAPQRHEEKRL
jgi:hypothetical protein